MGTRVFKDFKYMFECDQCGWTTFYQAGGRRKREVIKAVGYKKINGKWLCENCQEELKTNEK